MTGDEAMARLAERQYGVVSRAQLLAVGLSPAAIKHRVERARLHPVHRGVYRVGHTAPLPLATETAAVLACGDQAVLSHHSAGASIWQLIPRRDRMPEVTVPPGAPRRRPGIKVHRSSLSWAEVTTCRDVPVTTPARTLIDLSREAQSFLLERAVEDAERRRLVTRKGLLAAATGAPRLRAVLQREGGPAFTRSEAEARLTTLLRKAGLPAPEHNVRVGAYEVDMLWREARVIVEMDGYEFHSGRAAFERDRARDAELQAAGFKVIRVTWRQLVDTPERVVARIARML